jgi:hypothetical protein
MNESGNEQLERPTEPTFIPTALDPATTAEYDQAWIAVYPDGHTELVSGDGTVLDEAA